MATLATGQISVKANLFAWAETCFCLEILHLYKWAVYTVGEHTFTSHQPYVGLWALRYTVCKIWIWILWVCVCSVQTQKMNSGQSYLLFFLHLVPHLFGFDRCNLSMITEKENTNTEPRCLELRGCFKKLIEQMLHKESSRVLDVSPVIAGVGRESLISSQMIQTIALTSCTTQCRD